MKTKFSRPALLAFFGLTIAQCAFAAMPIDQREPGTGGYPRPKPPSYTKPPAPISTSTFGSASTAKCKPTETSRNVSDATCAGTSGVYGTGGDDNKLGSARPESLSITPRGSNSIIPTGVTVPVQAVPNQCVTVPFVSWAYDPASYGTSLPSFISTAGSGYVGSGGTQSPTGSCASDADESCTTWVPQSHPFLYLGGAHFQDCSRGAASSGSFSCETKGGAAYLTSNVRAAWNFSAYMVACKDNSQPPISINGAPAAWWSSCTGSSSCTFNIIYPMDSGGASAQ